MEFAIFIYLAATANKIIGILALVGIAILVVILLISGVASIENISQPAREKYPLESRRGQIATMIGVILILLAIILPTERTLYMMAAGYLDQKVPQSSISENIVKLINQKLDSYLVKEPSSSDKGSNK